MGHKGSNYLRTKILHCPTAVGGNPPGISRVLNELGVSSFSLVFEQNAYKYKVDRVLFRKKDGFLIREIKRILAIFTITWKFQVIHYNFGTTLASPLYPEKPGEGTLRAIARKAYSLYTWTLQYLELLILKALGKSIFVHYQGDDARQGSYSLKNFKFSIATEVDENYYNSSSDAFKQRSIKRMARFCDGIYALNPDLLHVLPEGSKFIPYCHLDLSDWSPIYSQSETNRPLRIGHAPSHRKAKGTELIIKALDSLREEGFSFDFVLVEGLSNEEARKKYETIDVLVDQLFAGWYGGLAVEAMALGKPVLVYLREEDLCFIPLRMRAELPFVRVCPESIKEGLEKVLKMPRPELLVLAKKSRVFIENWHDPLMIVKEIKEDYENALRKRGKI